MEVLQRSLRSEDFFKKNVDFSLGGNQQSCNIFDIALFFHFQHIVSSNLMFGSVFLMIRCNSNNSESLSRITEHLTQLFEKMKLDQSITLTYSNIHITKNSEYSLGISECRRSFNDLPNIFNDFSNDNINDPVNLNSSYTISIFS